jgi:hypothetical protein
MDPDVRHPADRRTRRPGSEGGQRLRNQWPIPAAGAPSTISGVGFAPVAVAEDTVHLGMLALYAATGGVFLSSRRGCPPAVPTGCRIRRLRAA